MKKVTVDLDKLLRDKVIDQGQYDSIAKTSNYRTSIIGILFLLGLGTIGIVTASVILDPSLSLLSVISAGMWLFGVALCLQNRVELRIVAQATAMIGTFGLSAWLVLNGVLYALPADKAFMLVSAFLLLTGVITRNGIMVALSVLAITPTLSVNTHYRHASYALVVENPIESTLVFGFIAVISYAIATQLRGAYARLGYTAAGTAFFMVNLAMWVGSLWGDAAGRGSQAIAISPVGFAALWCALSVGVGILGFVRDNRAAVNTAGVFLSINLYTQFYEFFLVNAVTLLTGSIVLVVLACTFWYYNAGYRPVLVVRTHP